MRKEKAISLLLVTVSLLMMSSVFATQSDGYGPEVKSFLELMRHEEDELEFQIKHNEISRPEYIRSKNRIAIHRQTILNLVKGSGNDYVPELHVAAASELDQLIEDGTSLVRGIKPGDVLKDKWRYIGSVRRGETFYIFERLTVK